MPYPRSTQSILASIVFCVVALCTAVPQAQAKTQHFAYGPWDSPVFQLSIQDVGDSDVFDGDTAKATHNLSATEKQLLLDAASHWAERLSLPAFSLPAQVLVTTDEKSNAWATSGFSQNSSYVTNLQEGLLTGATGDSPLALIGIGNGIGGIGWDEHANPSSLPLNGQKSDLVATMIHEIGHALGISSKDSFAAPLSPWDAHLYDSNGKKAEQGMNILLPGGTATGNDFDLSNENRKGYFSGENVAAVLRGASIAVVDSEGKLLGQHVPGIPLNSIEPNDKGSWGAELSHLELKNGLMGHQTYSNYSTFMELELAALQDIGYTIDRRNFYGSSIYGDDGIITNTQGYFLRNAAGTAYLEGQYNTASYGTGLHIYGSRNTVTQQADLLSGGLAGTGIRVDGEGNRLTIAQGTRVYANGPYGTGLLLAYGKDHTIFHQGQIEALGTQGIGARFDFGSANNGDALEYRGSYIHTVQNSNVALLPELNGALVKNFTVSGSLKGSAASIYISKNAFIENINILRGAELQGDIISKWDKDNPLLQTSATKPLLTQLNFGLAFDAQGAMQPDPLFQMSYHGNIIGATGLDMQVAGGRLIFNGNADVQTVSVNAGATLSGNAQYKVVTSFQNDGLLAPGNSIGNISIQGDFVQSSTGRLQVEFDASGRTDILAISGQSSLNGGLLLTPVRDFYRGTLNVAQDSFLQVQGSSTGNFDSLSLSLFDSPTLSMILTALPTTTGGTNFTINSQRSAQAYSRYAPHSNAARVGSALLEIANGPQHVSDDMQTLLATLDFSPADGSTVRQALPQLSPSIYASAAQASLDSARLLTRILTNRLADLAAARHSLASPREHMTSDSAQNSKQAAGLAPEWKAFVTPYGSSTSQDNHGSLRAYTSTDVGLLGGLERTFNNELLLGTHVAFNAGRVKAQDNLDAKNTNQSLYLGLHALLTPENWDGAYVYGLARGGVENNRLNREINFGGYSRSNTSEWTGFSAGAALGGGYDWQAGDWLFGPKVGLEYSMVFRPELTEADGRGTRLHLDSNSVHSLRSAAGAQAVWGTSLSERTRIKAQVSALWMHELLDDTQRLDASFADARSYGFTTKSRNPSRDSMGVQGGLSLSIDDTKHISVQVGTEFFRPGYTTLEGNIAVSWEF